MSGRISTRISIRWPPEEASEPTDTLVLSLGGHYVDLRIDKASQTIDWALAGQRIVVSEAPLKVEFTHPLDSHCTTPGDQSQDEADVGQFTKLPNGDDLEVGEMAAPHLGGRVMPYEEVWRELDPSDTTVAPETLSGGAKGWILESSDEDGKASTKTFYARIEGFFIAVRRKTCLADETERYQYAAIREDYDGGEQRWIQKYAVGHVKGIATMGEISDRSKTQERPWKVGDVVSLGTGSSSSSNSSIIVRAVSY